MSRLTARAHDLGAAPLKRSASWAALVTPRAGSRCLDSAGRRARCRRFLLLELEHQVAGLVLGPRHAATSTSDDPTRPTSGALRAIEASASAPTLVISGQRDRHLGPELAEPDHDDVPGVERLPDASHWVHNDEAERVTQLLIDFFAPSPRSR
jgi:pimeloyl-ACP methyl ester carboxylesterase